MLADSARRQGFLFLLSRPQAGEQEVILFNILGTEETFLSPKVSIRRMLIALNQQQRGRNNSLCMNVLPCSCDWLIFTTVNAVLRYMLKDLPSFQTTAALSLASSSQPLLPPNTNPHPYRRSYETVFEYTASFHRFQLL